MVDTRPEAAQILRDILARQTPAERLARAMHLSEEVRDLSLAALRERSPHEGFLRLVERITGEPMQSVARSGPRQSR
jgi:hypothetical protein